MGTVVFPEAPLKIYLTASVEERAQRRYKQLKMKGQNVNLSALLDDIQARDDRDMNRAVAPLRPADDAKIIDSSNMSIDEVFTEVLTSLQDKGLIGEF
jgi:cytidylate kinase